MCILFNFASPFLTLQPDIKDQQGWIKFCNGGVVDPTLDIVFCFTQALAEQLLEYLTEWVETERILSYHIGQWIYALLVILEEPLFPDTCFTLRSLARVCSALRAEQVILYLLYYN